MIDSCRIITSLFILSFLSFLKCFFFLNVLQVLNALNVLNMPVGPIAQGPIEMIKVNPNSIMPMRF